MFVPAGTAHTIGPGLVLCEIQQHSDLTYRLYDYNRRDAKVRRGRCTSKKRSRIDTGKQSAKSSPLAFSEVLWLVNSIILCYACANICQRRTSSRGIAEDSRDSHFSRAHSICLDSSSLQRGAVIQLRWQTLRRPRVPRGQSLLMLRIAGGSLAEPTHHLAYLHGR